MHDPLDCCHDPAKQQVLAELEQIGACIGCYDHASLHVELTPGFNSLPIGDAELPRIVDCVNMLGNVHGLDLGETAITDASAPHFARLQNVAFLSLNGTAVTDYTIPYLKSMGGLEELVLSGTAITDSAVEFLLDLHGLMFLQLYETQMTRKAVGKLKAKFRGRVEA